MPTAADLFHALPVSGKGIALLVSVSAHAAVVLLAASGAPHAAATTRRTPDALVELTTLVEFTTLETRPTEEPVMPAPQPAARASHHHDYPVPAEHDATAHDPSLPHVLGAPSSANLAAATTSAMEVPAPTRPHFSLIVAPAARPANGVGASSIDTGGQGASAASMPASEASVDTPARVLSNNPPSFTREAQAAGIEADVALEIVVDAAGSVLSARPLSHVGYGLEDAAVRSVRASRFLPARRAGKAVAVRMRWLIRFQLR